MIGCLIFVVGTAFICAVFLILAYDQLDDK